jgi:hypothetical protein
MTFFWTSFLQILEGVILTSREHYERNIHSNSLARR